MSAQCAFGAHSSSEMCAYYAHDTAVRSMHKTEMDTAWFKARKKEVRATDTTLAEAIGRDRTVVTKVINDKSAFDLSFVEPFARVLQVSQAVILEKVGLDPSGAAPPMPPSNAQVVQFEGDSLDPVAENLPVWGTGLGAPRLFEGEAVEQTTLNTGDVMEYVKRPTILRGKSMAYGLYVQGSSMDPALEDGDMVVAVKDMPLSAGDLVVVYFRDAEDDGLRSRGVLIKKLVRRSASWVELKQYEPAMTFRVPMADVLRIDRVLSRKEMLS